MKTTAIFIVTATFVALTSTQPSVANGGKGIGDKTVEDLLFEKSIENRLGQKGNRGEKKASSTFDGFSKSKKDKKR